MDVAFCQSFTSPNCARTSFANGRSRKAQPKYKKKASRSNRKAFRSVDFPGEGYAALRERAASTKGRYFSLSFIQCAARPFASASLASGKVTKGTRVGPTLQ